MSTPTTTEHPESEPVDRLLRAADPWSTPIASTLAQAVATEVVASERITAASARRRRKRRIAGVTAALLLGVPATAAASYQLAAQTGWFGSPGMTENDTSEWIDLCADDFPTYFATLPTPTDAPPAGLTWAEVGDRIVAQKQAAYAADCAPSGDGVREQSTALESSFYVWADQLWTCRAVRAHEAGDESSFRSNAERAATMMDRLDQRGSYGDDNWRPIRDALRAGDYPTIRQSYDANGTEAWCE